MKKFLVWLIKQYQKYISFDTGIAHKILPHLKVCRFTPSCSQYTIDAIEKYGTFKGLFLGFKRILRCSPFSKGGLDPVR